MRFPTKVITIDEEFRFEVLCDPLDREDGCDDDIRLTMHESQVRRHQIIGSRFDGHPAHGGSG